MNRRPPSRMAKGLKTAAKPAASPFNFRLGAACVLVLGGLSFVAFHVLRDEPSRSSAQVTSVQTSEMGSTREAPAVIEEYQGAIPQQKHRTPVELPPTVIQPLVGGTARAVIGEKNKIRFQAKDRKSGLPETLTNVSVEVMHGKNVVAKLPVEEVDNGVYEVAFTPPGPGVYNMVLSANGTQVGSQRVGVPGVAGGGKNDSNTFDPINADPRVYYSKTPSRSRRR
jgi:hypothetical protein